jgi:hypothetical protein
MCDSAARQGLIHEITEAVFKRTEAQIADHLEDVDSKGQRALEAAQRQQLELVSEMQSNLERYAGSYDRLVQQNAELRSGLEMATRVIQMLQWSSAVPPGGPPMQAPWALPGAGWQMPAKAGIAQHGAKSGRSSSPKLPSMPEDVESDLTDEDDESLTTSPMRTFDGAQGQSGEDAATLSPESVDLGSPLSSGSYDTLSDDTPADDSSGGKLQYHSTIAMTIRRVDGEPLGLEVLPDIERSCLHVERIQPGTVVEAWNRLCSGERRAILPGDRVVSVNGATTPEDMRKEFGQKLLLKLEVVRGNAA